MRKILILALLVMPIIVMAEPSPFGLEIRKATVSDVKAKYNAKKTGINKYSNGEVYGLDVSGINFEGLQEATLIFGQEGKLLAVLTKLPKNKFDYLLNNLSAKYKLVSKQIPFVGNKSAKFVDGNTDITLDAPHMGFGMEMNYVNKDLLKSYYNQSNKEKQNKQKSEQSQL